MDKKRPHDRLMMVLGTGGIIFYAIGPLIFPDAKQQPELLPVYTTMLGLGVLGKKKGDE